MIHGDLVPVEKICKETIDIWCAHGDVVSYPLVEVSVSVGDHTFSSQAAVSDWLPVPVVLRRGVPNLISCLVLNSVMVQRWWQWPYRARGDRWNCLSVNVWPVRGSQGPYPTYCKRCPSVSWTMACLRRAGEGMSMRQKWENNEKRFQEQVKILDICWRSVVMTWWSSRSWTSHWSQCGGKFWKMQIRQGHEVDILRRMNCWQ